MHDSLTLNPLTEAMAAVERLRLDLLPAEISGPGVTQAGVLRSVAAIKDLLQDLWIAARTPSVVATSGRVVYLAGPYSHHDPAVRAARAQRLTEVAAELTAGRLHMSVLSPITMGHQYALAVPEISSAYAEHRTLCEAMMAASHRMIIIAMDGVQQSAGVREEVRFFKRLNRDIRVLVGDDDTTARLIPLEQWQHDTGWDG